MLKNILKLEGAQKLPKEQQKGISGGIAYCLCIVEPETKPIRLCAPNPDCH